jgi:hypothetical protein
MEVKDNMLGNQEPHLLINIELNHNSMINKKDILLGKALLLIKRQNKMLNILLAIQVNI